ncbi:hypothetical protein DKX38_026621 [Salix brachista]|uniref:Uncharacterized protein n=1 Tax=Salix brachista TaxID=2182728 RepID=A0A5N5JF85_9ROSI|nr:hypothetical protein DKX38_026621 [Salix brachista]
MVLLSIDRDRVRLGSYSYLCLPPITKLAFSSYLPLHHSKKRSLDCLEWASHFAVWCKANGIINSFDQTVGQLEM